MKLKPETCFPFLSDYLHDNDGVKGEKLFQTLTLRRQRMTLLIVGAQPNGISSFVCHHSHKPRRQNIVGHIPSIFNI